MSSFLWVEDFEGKLDDLDLHKQFANNVFGEIINKNKKNEFSNIIDIPSFIKQLKRFNIKLVRNYASAAKEIEENLDDYDFIILDIDLILGEDIEENDSEDFPWVLPILKKWYDFDENEDNDELYDQATNAMRLVAGYHLYISLIFDKSFPKEKILFCSNHGDNLIEMAELFKSAKINYPKIYRKEHEGLKEEVLNLYNNKYLQLRRWIIIACHELKEKIKFNELKFLLPELLKDKYELNNLDAIEILEILPKLLPQQNIYNSHQIFRLFVRTLTQNFDNKIEWHKLKDNDVRAYNSVLMFARNCTSHDSKALTNLDESDISFLFLIAIRLSFNLPKKLEKFEIALLDIIDKESEIDIVQLESGYETSYYQIESQCTELIKSLEIENTASTKPYRFKQMQSRIKSCSNGFFDDMIKALSEEDKIKPSEYEKMLYQIFWHRVYVKNNNKEFRSSYKMFNSSKFLSLLSKHSISKFLSEN